MGRGGRGVERRGRRGCRERGRREGEGDTNRGRGGGGGKGGEEGEGEGRGERGGGREGEGDTNRERWGAGETPREGEGGGEGGVRRGGGRGHKGSQEAVRHLERLGLHGSGSVHDIDEPPWGPDQDMPPGLLELGHILCWVPATQKDWDGPSLAHRSLMPLVQGLCTL